MQNMKYFVAESVMNDPLPVTAEELKSVFVPQHVAHLQEGIAAGLLLLGGPSETGGGFLLLRAETRAEAEAFLERDPFRKNGINRFRLTEFTPSERSAFVQDW